MLWATKVLRHFELVIARLARNKVYICQAQAQLSRYRAGYMTSTHIHQEQKGVTPAVFDTFTIDLSAQERESSRDRNTRKPRTSDSPCKHEREHDCAPIPRNQALVRLCWATGRVNRIRGSVVSESPTCVGRYTLNCE